MWNFFRQLTGRWRFARGRRLSWLKRFRTLTLVGRREGFKGRQERLNPVKIHVRQN